MLRFAPSPTGDIHIGNLRIAIINYVMAKKLQQKYILRIEDTDLARNIQGKDEEIIALMKDFNITFDDIIYQSNNFPLHRDNALKLIKEGKAFYCYCSSEFLEEKRDEAIKNKIPFRYKDEWATLQKGNKTSSDIIRLRVNEGVSFCDLIKGDITFNKSDIDSFVIMRNDVPVYNFACAIDDENMSVIIRGEDHVSNTPKQILIKKALNMNVDSKYAHLPIILNDENKKMSKRDNHSSVKWLLENAIENSAIMNYLLILGNAKMENCINDAKIDFGFSMDEASQYFDISSISKNPARFDYKKLLHINKEILRHYPLSKIKIFLADIFKDNNKFENGSFDDLIELYVNESNNVNSLKQDLQKLFLNINDKRILSAEYQSQFDILKNAIIEMDEYFENYIDFKNALMTKTNLKGKEFFKPLRMLLSGKDSGIEIELLYNCIKKHLKDILQ